MLLALLMVIVATCIALCGLVGVVLAWPAVVFALAARRQFGPGAGYLGAIAGAVVLVAVGDANPWLKTNPSAAWGLLWFALPLLVVPVLWTLRRAWRLQA